MRILISPAEFAHEKDFLFALGKGCEALGHIITLDPPFDLVIQWGARNRVWDGPTLFAECGWLPRWWYQLSHTGINARHHLAPLKLEPLDDEQRWKAETHLKLIRSGVDAPKGWGYLDIAAPPAEYVPDEFILAPLQMENDVNSRDVPEYLRTNQGFVDVVSERTASNVRIVFKQHPNTRAAGQLALKTRRKGDKIYPHKQASVYQYLKHPGCIAVVTANSNVANDALLWDVPTVPLGSGIWPEDAFDPENRSRYVYALMRAQWQLKDAHNPQRVEQAIEEAMR